MSTRWYPRYIKGNPQLRVFLPNFFMKLIKPRQPVPPNQLVFMVSMEMTKYDVKNYLEKMYKVPVEEVRTNFRLGEFKKDEMKGYIKKDDDYKLAYVTMPKGESFVFPDLYPVAKKNEEMDKNLRHTEALKEHKTEAAKNAYRPGIPPFFAL